MPNVARNSPIDRTNQNVVDENVIWKWKWEIINVEYYSIKLAKNSETEKFETDQLKYFSSDHFRK